MPQTDRYVLFVGNDYRKKGLRALIRALALLPDDVSLAVVGRGEHRDEFEALAATLGVANRVRFLGTLDDVEDAYVAADCLAHPTLEDTFAMVVLEALAHALPVVVSGSKYCGISALLRHETNALILEEPRDSAVLASALARIFQDDALSSALRAGALAFAAQYHWPAIASLQEEIYFSTLRAEASGGVTDSA